MVILQSSVKGSCGKKNLGGTTLSTSPPARDRTATLSFAGSMGCFGSKVGDEDAAPEQPQTVARAETEVIKEAPTEATSAEAVEVGSASGVGSPPRTTSVRDIFAYQRIDGLRNFLIGGSVALVKASYILELAATPNAVLLRRQDLPQHALVDDAMLGRCLEELDRSYGRSYLGEMFLPIVIASYCWMSPSHPDGGGRQLREVLAPAVEWYMSERAGRIANNWSQGSSKDPASNPRLTADAIDFALFIDYCSLPQKPRSEAEDVTFRHALTHMDILYAHSFTVVWKLTRRLEGYESVPSYDERGWPYFESCACSLVKKAGNSYNLGLHDFTQPIPQASDKKRLGGYCGERYKERAERGLTYLGLLKSPLELAEQATHESCVSTGFEITLSPNSRQPPVLPGDFADVAPKRTFTNDADVAVVCEMYAGLVGAVLHGAESLDYNHSGWGLPEAKVLAAMLPQCPNLTELNVRMNAFSNEAGAIIFNALDGNGSLKKLRIDSCRLGDEAAIALGSLLAKDSCVLESVEASCSGFTDDGLKAIAQGMVHSTSLKTLNVNQSRYGQDGILAFVPVLASENSLASLDLSFVEVLQDDDTRASILAKLDEAVKQRNTPVDLRLHPF